MSISKESLLVALELLDCVIVKPTEENCDEKWKRSRTATLEFRQALGECEAQKCQQPPSD